MTIELKCPKCGSEGFEHFTGKGHLNWAVDSDGQTLIEKEEIKPHLCYVCENVECGYEVERSSDLYKALEKLRMETKTMTDENEYETIFHRFKWICSECKTIDDVIKRLEEEIGYFKDLKSKGYTIEGDTDDYMQIIPPDSKKCPECGKDFDSIEEMHNHVWTHFYKIVTDSSED